MEGKKCTHQDIYLLRQGKWVHKETRRKMEGMKYTHQYIYLFNKTWKTSPHGNMKKDGRKEIHQPVHLPFKSVSNILEAIGVISQLMPNLVFLTSNGKVSSVAFV